MAGDWIKLELTTPDKPEILAIAETLKIAPEHALGCVLRVWIWADQQSKNGDALRVTDVTLDRIACYAGVTQALCDVGWARKLSTGYALVNFDRHNGKTAKNRALTKQRMQRFRDADVTRKPSPEKRRELPTKSTNSIKYNPASEQPAGQPVSGNSRSNPAAKPGESAEDFKRRMEHGTPPQPTPKPAAQSLEKAAQAIQEARQAAQTASPMPEAIRTQLKRP